MFLTKRGRIAAYLKTAAPSPFAALLEQWYSGQMRGRMESLGLTKPEFHIDRLPDYKCIYIQGRSGKLYVNIQIEPDAFTIAVDPDEPDEPVEFPLESPERFYETVRSHI